MKIALFLMLFYCFFSLNAQNTPKKQHKTYKSIIQNAKTKKFQSLVNEIEAYYSKPKNREQKEYKKFLRWKTFAENRLDANGEIANIGQLTYEASLKQRKNVSKTSKNRLKSGNTGSTLQWENIFHEIPLNRGRVDCIAVDPSNSNIIYAGANTGGVWKTTNGGLNWVPLTDNLPTLGVTSIVIDPNSPANNRKIFILVGDGGWGAQYHSTGIYVTNDDGATWSPTSLQFDETISLPSARKLVMDPLNSNILYAVFWTSIYKTLDGGSTWTKLGISNTHGAGLYDLEISPDDSQILYVVERNQVFHRSDDGGSTWSSSTIPVGSSTGSAQIGIAVTAANPNVVYYLNMNNHATDNSKFGGIYKSTDKGLTFTLFEDDMPDNLFLLQRNGIAEIVVSPVNENDIFVGSFRTYRYNENSSNLEVIDSQNAHVDVRGLFLINGRLFSCNDGGLDVSDNYQNWQDISNGLLIKQIYEIDTDFDDSKKIHIGTQDNGFSVVDNVNEEQISGGDAYHVAASKLFDRVYFNVGFSTLMAGSTNPIALRKIESISNGSSPMLVYDSYSQNGIDTDVLLVADGVDITRALVDQDFNFTWENLSNGQFTYRWVGLDVSETNKNSFYGISANGTNLNGIVKSVNLLDAQPTFTDITSAFPQISNKLTSVTMSNDEPEKVWLACGGYNANEKAFYSMNGGQTWVNISQGLPNTPVNSLVYQDLDGSDIIYAATDIGVYFFVGNQSTEWLPYCLETLPTTIVHSLKYNSNDEMLTAGTWGRGIWQIEALSEVPSTLSADVEDGIIKTNDITIYPNPTRSTFYISSKKSIDAEFDIHIYDLSGKKVISIRANKILSNIPLEVDISKLKSGVYVLKLNSQSIGTLKKVLKN